MQTNKLVGSIIVASLFIGTWAYLGLHNKAEEKPLLAGMVEVREIPLSPRISGRILEMKFEDGDSVSVGQTIALIASPELAAKVEAAQGQLNSANARLKMAKNGARKEEIRQAEAGFKAASEQRQIAETTTNRLFKLVQQKAISTQQYDEAKSKTDALIQQELAAKAKLDQAKNGARSEDIDAAKGQATSAEEILKEALSWKSETSLISPINGIIQKRYSGVGELVAPGLPVVVLIQPEQAWIQIPVREDMLKSFKIGQKLKGEIPALELKNVELKVTWIAPMGDFATWRSTARRGDADLRSFEVRLKTTKPVLGLLPGMQVLIPSFEKP
jgi:HlyD family secretion protein